MVSGLLERNWWKSKRRGKEIVMSSSLVVLAMRMGVNVNADKRLVSD